VTVSGRPVLNLSLALNYAVGGFDLRGFHAFNLLIHILSGLTLFGIVRRTLELRTWQTSTAVGRGRRTPPQDSAPAGADDSSRAVGRSLATDDRPQAGFQHDNAHLVALTVALLWTLHPLQTEAVTYIIQRTESLMGLFFLLTFYCFIRSVEAPRPRRWQVLAVVACLLGVGTKEVAAVAPILVFLYDRTFVAGSFRGAWRRRRWLHLGLAATWLPLALLVSSTGWNRGGTSGFAVGVAPLAYWLTQFKAVACYLKLAVWPHPLVFEYGTFWGHPVDALPYVLIVVPLAVVTVVALWRWPVCGFLGAWFFAILAPTSLVPGTIQMIVEHRMYLPLAAVIAFVVGSVVGRCGRAGLAVCLVLALSAGVITTRRNAVYRSDLSLWQDTVDKASDSAIAQSSLGTALFQRGRFKEAMQHYQVSVRLNSNLATIHYNLGLTHAATGHLTEAAAQFAESFRVNPRFYPARYQLGLTLVQSGRPEEALTHFAQAAQLMPTLPETQCEWGVALFHLGRIEEAISHYREALRLKPDYAEAECDLGVALDQTDRTAEAIQCFQRALRINPEMADAHFNFGLTLARTGSTDRATAEYAEAVRLNPKHRDAQLNLGIALTIAGNLPEALAHLEQAVQLGPDLPAPHCNLGIALAAAGRLEEAVDHYDQALRLKPDYAGAHYNLGNALLGLRRVADAKRHFEKAVRIDPSLAAAREMLARLRVAAPSPDPQP
jgi:tetratricopeptide (TPR) repeat protein